MLNFYNVFNIWVEQRNISTKSSSLLNVTEYSVSATLGNNY
jgi:hypothetical protein